MISTLAEIEAFLHRQIPITRAMEVRVLAYDESELVIEAPLAANHNHLGTAFGGSLSALSILAGYAMLWLELRSETAHIVIQESSIAYLRPVQSDLRAVCRKPTQARMAAFRQTFERKGRARIKLPVVIEENGKRAVEFEGTFVAVTERK